MCFYVFFLAVLLKMRKNTYFPGKGVGPGFSLCCPFGGLGVRRVSLRCRGINFRVFLRVCEVSGDLFPCVFTCFFLAVLLKMRENT